MVLTPAQKQANYRTRKAAKDFSKDFMDAVNIATPKEYIKAKETEVCIENGCGSVQFNSSLTQTFYDYLKEFDNEDGQYIIDELMEAWKLAEDEYHS